MTEYNPPRGMRDIFDREASLYEYLFNEFRSIARRHGFKPIITPTIEYFSLFEAKSGEEIKKSMYVFEDKAGRLLALRPEVTASVTRAYLKAMRGYPKPIRLYYIAQCFRYEEPQYARYREFWQAGLEIIGDPDVNADIAVAITASDFLDKIGVKHQYEIGNVSTYRALMSRLGVDVEMQDHILHLIDKDKVDEALSKLDEIVGERADIFRKILYEEDLDALSEFINEEKALLGDLYERVIAEHERLRLFIESLRELGYDARFNPRLVRGLAYYTGLIFEYKVLNKRELPSIGGGGRYDGLTTVYGGPFEYSTGLALGIDRVILAIDEEDIYQEPKLLIILLSGSVPIKYGYTIQRKINSSVEKPLRVMVYKPRSLSRGLEYSSKIGADLVIIIGDRELSEKSVIVKNMKNATQVKVKVDELLGYIDRAT